MSAIVCLNLRPVSHWACLVAAGISLAPRNCRGLGGLGVSSKGIYSAVSGAMAQSARLDTIANNLANVNTTSFKKDQQIFSEYLTANEKEAQFMKVPRVPASIESFYDMQGGDTAYVNPAGSYTNFSQGALRPSGSQLDVGIEGKGFFEVMTPQGLRWTRNGSFKIDASGQLVTKEGHLVLREGAQDPAQRGIQLSSANLTISQAGEIFEGGNLIGKLAVVEFSTTDDLRKVGNSLYSVDRDPALPAITIAARESRVHQGFLEGSNVNVIQEMTDMISANRVFEATQQAIKAHDLIDDKLINQVGKL